VHKDHLQYKTFLAFDDTTGGRCSEVALCYKNWDPKLVVALDQRSFFEGGRLLRFESIIV
jgi:hypothetical protein